MPASNYVPRYIALNRTVFFCTWFRLATIKPFDPQLPEERDLHTSFLLLSTAGSITLAHFTSPIRLRRSAVPPYVFEYSCFHVDVVPSMDTISCVMRVERLVYRWGTLDVICPDIVTNCIGTLECY